MTHLVQFQNLRKEVEDLLKKLGAFKIRVADPQKGFDRALEGCHPRDIMENCNAIIVFAFSVGLDYYTSIKYQKTVDSRILYLYRDYVELRLASFLRKRGYNATEVPKANFDEKKKIAALSYKLAAYEAGIGVFGRPSILITSEYGPRINLGVVLTNASLEPDKRISGFEPCRNCQLCIKICPIKCIKDDWPPPTGFNRNKCVQFIDWIREKTQGNVGLCGYCFNYCTGGKIVKKALRITRWKTLVDIKMQQRKELIERFEYAFRSDAGRHTLNQAG